MSCTRKQYGASRETQTNGPFYLVKHSTTGWLYRYYTAIWSLYRHVVCDVPVSFKANWDRNQLWAWLVTQNPINNCIFWSRRSCQPVCWVSSIMCIAKPILHVCRLYPYIMCKTFRPQYQCMQLCLMDGYLRHGCIVNTLPKENTD